MSMDKKKTTSEEFAKRLEEEKEVMGILSGSDFEALTKIRNNSNGKADFLKQAKDFGLSEFMLGYFVVALS